MPDSKIEPRTLTADEQAQLVYWLYEQRLAQNDLQATGLTNTQLHHLGRMMNARFHVHAVLNLPEALWAATPRYTTEVKTNA